MPIRASTVSNPIPASSNCCSASVCRTEFAALSLAYYTECAGGELARASLFGCSLPLQGIFDRQRHAHTAAHAEGGQAAARFALQHFVEQRDRDARSSAADGMAECDGATVDVELLAIEMQLAIARQYLGGEGFIQFDQIEVAELDAVFLFHFADGRHWPYAHEARIHADRSHGENSRPRFQIILLNEFLASHDHSRCAVGDTRRISSSNGAGLGKNWSQLGHLLHHGVWGPVEK